MLHILLQTIVTDPYSPYIRDLSQFMFTIIYSVFSCYKMTHIISPCTETSLPLHSAALQWRQHNARGAELSQLLSPRYYLEYLVPCCHDVTAAVKIFVSARTRGSQAAGLLVPGDPTVTSRVTLTCTIEVLCGEAVVDRAGNDSSPTLKFYYHGEGSY